MKQIDFWEWVFDATQQLLPSSKKADVWGNWSTSPEYCLNHHTTDAQVVGPEKEAETCLKPYLYEAQNVLM